MKSKWMSREPGSKISTDEALAFKNYFVSVEVVLDDVLTRIYFPIPKVGGYSSERLNRL